jgi:hypothetical protein
MQQSRAKTDFTHVFDLVAVRQDFRIWWPSARTFGFGSF